MLAVKPFYLMSLRAISYKLNYIPEVKNFAFLELEKIFYFSFEHYIAAINQL